MFKDIGKLIYITQASDSDGYPVQTEIETEVFLNKKSVTRQEFYLATQVGTKPTIVFEVRLEDWELTKHMNDTKPEYATKIEFEAVKYDVIRSYSKNESIIEITCG